MKIPMPVVFALITALFWGLYGPALGNARHPEHSAFKPYMGVGLAYTVWGLLGGLLAMWLNHDSFSFTTPAGTQAGVWGFLAGTLGAVGALSLTFAMFAGGAAMPQVVMPVVFGGAVTVTAVTTMVRMGGTAKVSPWLWVGILGMGVCTIIIAYNTPHPHPKKPATPGSADAHAAVAAPTSADDAAT